MNYTELKTAVEDYVEDSFTAAAFAIMTKMAEQKIYQVAQFPISKYLGTGALTIGSPYFDMPAGFLSMFNFAIVSVAGEQTFLLDKDPNFIREAYPAAATTGTPKYYGIFGPQAADPTEIRLIVGPTPVAALNVEYQYFGYPETIVTATSTWLSENCELALLKATIYEAGIFMKEEADVLAVYKEEMSAALAIVKQLIDGKDRQDVYRSGQYRAKVG